ncbi:hypothetical protein NQZ68_013381 [Dissostichus eleginoides]|nr:hypothetical protein NQZ68_013381 [Dissostichus eleginoides]
MASLSAITLSFAAVDSRPDRLDSISDSFLFLFSLKTPSSRDDALPGLGGRGGPVLRALVSDG